MLKGIMPKREGFPFSRDFAITLKCDCENCYLNSMNECAAPSVVEIDNRAICKSYKHRERR